MSYEKQNFKPGQVLTASHMNHIENGIAAIEDTVGTPPVRGVDYWTAADIAEIKGYVDEAILGGAW